MLMEIQGQETVSDCKNPFRTFYIAVTHFGVWLLICIYAIKIKQKLICIAVCYAACLILWDDLHFETDSYNIIRDRLRKTYGNLALYQKEGRNDQKYYHKDLCSETV